MYTVIVQVASHRGSNLVASERSVVSTSEISPDLLSLISLPKMHPTDLLARTPLRRSHRQPIAEAAALGKSSS